MINIGVVGAGAWGLNLVRNIALSPLTELVAVCDPDEDARRTVASRYRGAPTTSSLDEFLATACMDAVVVASPAGLHYEHACAALQAGFHVLVEKPLAASATDAAELVLLARRLGRVLMVGHTFLYNNLVEEVKRRIEAGDLGKVRYMYGQRLNLGRVRRDVDTLWNLAPHDISIANFLQGDRPIGVNARGATYVQTERNIADVAFFQMNYAGGQLFSGHVSWLDPQKTRRIVVVGSERMLVYDDMDASRHIQIYDKRVEPDFQSPMRDFADFTARVTAGDLVIPNIRLKEPLSVEVEHFAACVRDESRPRTDGCAGVELVCILEAMSASMEQAGSMVEVDYSAVPDIPVPAVTS
jgi:predicted dehydrogenase